MGHQKKDKSETGSLNHNHKNKTYKEKMKGTIQQDKRGNLKVVICPPGYRDQDLITISGKVIDSKVQGKYVYLKVETKKELSQYV